MARRRAIDEPEPRRQDAGRAEPARLRLEDQILALQPQIGNRAVGRMLQRLDVDDIIGGPASRITEYTLWPLWDAAVAYGRSQATPFKVPEWYVDALRDYAKFNSGDGDILWAAWMRAPEFFVGGLVASDSDAMTMDRTVFCDGPPTVDTWIHELVHVWQYGLQGPIRFLISMLGTEAAGVLWKLRTGEKFDLFKNSVQEVQGYSLEQRFTSWRRRETDYPINGTYEGRKIPSGASD